MSHLEQIVSQIDVVGLRRIAAPTLLAIVLLLIVLGLVRPVMLLGFGDDTARSRQALLESYQRVSSSRGDLEAKIVVLTGQQKDLGDFVPGRTASLAPAELLSLVDKLVTSQGATPTSIEIEPAQTVEGYSKIAVRLQLSTDIGTLRAILYHIENDRPRLFIEKMGVHHKEKSDDIDINMQIYGFYDNGK